MANQVALLAAARTSLETIAAPSIGPTTTLGSSTFTWTEMLDLVQTAFKKANGNAEDRHFHEALTQLWTDLEAGLDAT